MRGGIGSEVFKRFNLTHLQYIGKVSRVLDDNKNGDIYHEMRLEKLVWTLEFSN